ncbi:hypothetical protein ACRRTK_013799 [Alexandromys fortis]
MASGPESQLLMNYEGHEGLRTLPCKEFFLLDVVILSPPLSSYHVDGPEWA